MNFGELSAFIVCPITGEDVHYDEEKNLIVNESGTYGYPIEDGIPLMLETKAIDLRK